MKVGGVNLKGNCRSLYFSAARQWAQFNALKSSSECNCAARGGLACYESILMIRFHSNASSEKTKCSSLSTVFFIPALTALNDFFRCAEGDTFLELIRYK